MKGFLFSLLIMSLLVLSASSRAQSSSKISFSLQRAIESAESQTPIKAWVFFTDKGPNVQEQLQNIEQNLTPRSLARRMRNRQNRPLVDFYDLPVRTEYIQQIASRVVRIRHKSRWLNAVSVEATPASLRQIAALNFVKRLDIVHEFRRPLPETKPAPKGFTPPTEDHILNYGASFTQNNQINVPALHDLGYDGSGVLVCMLDAGFNNLQHEALDHLHIWKTWDFVNGDSIVWDQPGQMGTGDHGTYTLSALAGYAPGNLIGPAYGATFILAKTENTDYEQHIEEDNWVAGAEWADSLGADIISSSLGYRDFDPGQGDYTWQDMDGNTTIVTIGADIAASRGILVVNSAGNEGSATPPQNTLVAPADGDSVVAVGAVDASGNRVYFSSMGPTADGRIKPDVMAMGSDVISASASNPTGYTGVSGTSLSCPLVAGASALILQVNPHLSNMQIRKALRQTASQASSPDNAYGWGIIDAYAAAFYYTPQIVHQPLHDTEDLQGPYVVQAEITSNFPLNPDSLRLYYRYDQSNYQWTLLTSLGNNQYEGQIPGPGSPANIYYYLKAATDSGFAYSPVNAPQEVYHFYAGPDLVPPTIIHNALQNVAYLSWPVEVRATITDNQLVDENSVLVEWRLNGNEQTAFHLNRVQGDLFAGMFNSDTSQVAVGDVIEYRIVARDMAATPNVSYHPAQGYHSFTLLSTRGLVLILDDETSVEGQIESRGQVVDYHPTESVRSVNIMQHYLQQLNFLVTVEPANSSDPAQWNQYNILISASGENPSPVQNSTYRQNLINWVQNGGKLLVEGGEVGYDAVSSGNYVSFYTQVLHSTDWNGDDEGALTLVSGFQDHPIVSYPNQLPAQIPLIYDSYLGWYDQDAMLPDNQAYIVYECAQEPGHAGILVYDDNAYPESAQIVYYPFDFASIADTNVAKNLLENTLTFLMTNDLPTAIDDGGPLLPESPRLYPAYPNPFNPTTTIRYYLPDAESVQLKVYNTLGQVVAELVQGKQQAGLHRIQWEASQQASGIYFIQLRTQKRILTQKVMLLK